VATACHDLGGIPTAFGPRRKIPRTVSMAYNLMKCRPHEALDGREDSTMSSSSIRNFMKQQGFVEEPDNACNMHFSGLYFQPRIVGSLVVAGIVLQFFSAFGAAVLYLMLSALLWWNVAVPKANPFEVFYNHVLAIPRGQATLAPAPGPRRFAQGMAAVFMLIVGVALLQGWVVTAYVFEAGLVTAFSALLFGKFCLGAYIYHLTRGNVAFANSTLPWSGRPRRAQALRKHQA
jgi:Domain of unknown function (DUF4395)